MSDLFVIFRPSCRERMMPWRYVSGVASMSAFKVVKSITGLISRYTPRMGHRPPFDCWRSFVLVCMCFCGVYFKVWQCIDILSGHVCR
jgi:hypothetical protein